MSDSLEVDDMEELSLDGPAGSNQPQTAAEPVQGGLCARW